MRDVVLQNMQKLENIMKNLKNISALATNYYPRFDKILAVASEQAEKCATKIGIKPKCSFEKFSTSRISSTALFRVAHELSWESMMASDNKWEHGKYNSGDIMRDVLRQIPEEN